MSAVAAAARIGVRALHRRPVSLRGDLRGGELADLLFDDQRWVVRYLVIDDRGPMPRRHLVVQPARVEALAPGLQLALSREELKHCPELGADPPVYLQHDMVEHARPADPHLRSAEIILGFGVRSRGERIGRLTDIELDAERWTIEALVVDSGVWLPGKRSVVDPRAVRAMDWIGRTIDI